MAPGAAAATNGRTVTAAASSAQDTRALWVWDTSTPAATVDLAVSTGIDQLFVAVPPNLATSSQLPDIKALSDRARAAGIRVDALGGDPGWVDNPTWVVTYWLKPAKSSGLFTGIHVDIEPYSTPAWGADRPLSSASTSRCSTSSRPTPAPTPSRPTSPSGSTRSMPSPPRARPRPWTGRS
jgi:hypothetical protein